MQKRILCQRFWQTISKGLFVIADVRDLLNPSILSIFDSTLYEMRTGCFLRQIKPR